MGFLGIFLKTVIYPVHPIIFTNDVLAYKTKVEPSQHFLKAELLLGNTLPIKDSRVFIVLTLGTFVISGLQSPIKYR